MHQRAEKRRRQRIEVGLRLADDVPRHEFRSVLEHVDEPVQLAQHIVRNMARGPRLAVEIDWNLGVAEADLLDKGTQIDDRRVELGAGSEFLVVDRQDERRRARLLLGELRQVAVTGHAEDFHALLLDRRRQRADAEPRSVFRAEVFIDDYDGEAEFHGYSPVPGSSPAVAMVTPPAVAQACRLGVERRELCGDSQAVATGSTGRLDRSAGRGRRPAQILGSVTPCCPWYLPPRSL